MIKNHLVSLPFLYLVTTCTYVLLWFLGLGVDASDGAINPIPASFLGMFVPIGPNNFFILMSPFVLAVLVLSVFAYRKLDKKISETYPTIPIWKRFFINTGCLLVITLIVDLISMATPMGFIIFMNALSGTPL